MNKELYNDGEFIIDIDTDTNKYIVYEIENNKKVKINVHCKTYQYAERLVELRLTEKRKNMKPLECLHKNCLGEMYDYTPARILSIDKTQYKTDVKISYDLSETSQGTHVDIWTLLKNTKKNVKILNEIKYLIRTIHKLNSETEKFTSEELIKHFNK